MAVTAEQLKELACEAGFQLAGIAPAIPLDDFALFEAWRETGMAGEMTYLTDHRGDKRSDPHSLLPNAQSILCVGKLYHSPYPLSTDYFSEEHRDRGWISRYAWGKDYHDVLREGLEQVVNRLRPLVDEPFAWKICVDTAPLLERSYARMAGLGWIGKNTCLINQKQGSWFLLGELLLSFALAPDIPPPDRCGTCRRCIDACPTQAIIPDPAGHSQLDARLCISYLTIEKRGEVPSGLHESIGQHVFGCDICQDVCPWNRRAPNNCEDSFFPAEFAPSLDRLAMLTESEFRDTFRYSPIWRAKYTGFLRNVAIAMGNSGLAKMREPLEHLASYGNDGVAAAARQSLARLAEQTNAPDIPV